MMSEKKKPMNGIAEVVPLDKQEFQVRMDRIVKALNILSLMDQYLGNQLNLK